ncbi:Hemolysin, contains CBS domains [Thermoactinomyces sp. DSM 45891]|uniref:hemolysin family protein n=1 Tax=Thermoactinomyces sp. DSM 45891 TaxID=1761907 RepID=UPI00091B55CA|nr:hemolysin family protein [Thermoactinomyces sp. DSM 45891]SFX11950.1 Hemolysin, contains CBS domains [Thermoactinomyces sp. DSM 45891]
MDDFIEIILNLLLVLFLVLLNGFFVASEFAIVKARSTRIQSLTTSRGKIAQKVISKMDAYLSATQLGITLASLGLGWVGEPAIAKMLEPLLSYLQVPEYLLHPIAFVVAFTIITFLHIVVGEMAPKTLAIHKAEQTTLWTARPLHWFYMVFKPFIVFLNGAANRLLRLMGMEFTEDHQHVHTEEEIRLVIKHSYKSGMIDQTELKLFDNVFDFTARITREVMIPRVNIMGLDLDASWAQNAEIIRSTKYARFPVYRGDKDEIVGMLLVRDLYDYIWDQKEFNIEDHLRPVLSIPETMEIKDVMIRMQKSKSHLAIVVDEFGGTSGLITLEDIFEEIFGEIQDEFDEEEPEILKTAKGALVHGHVLIDEVNKYLQLDINDSSNDTIGGWLFSKLEKLPTVGDFVEYKGHKLLVEQVDQRRISKVLIEKTMS